MPITLIGRATSINVRKVLWTCAEIGLDYTFDKDWVGEAAVRRRDELLALNPNGQFPVLVEGDWSLWQSNAICRHLATVAGREDLLPTAPRARALVEQWMDWQVSDLNQAWRYAYLALVRRMPAFTHADEIAASVVAWNKAMVLLDRQLERTGAHVTGPTFTLADIVLALSANRWRLTPIEHADCPAVDAWLTGLAGRPGFTIEVGPGVP
ncbi:glutathione S-transferase family protein [Nitrospirillum sp. BR 11163]|uniref:glutathione S-transferase family protein n=1 Tax=Nitrospirillum sp. BR 11163 TaxID=3104323 RepID=UPI002AFF80D6|nr:glutathione S-transferase N-terminal domain-containing protein [Nitrospirillum sp. BR 11163]MEA1674731.1 glutathione S-transferase N-terminal domain-containing protein [Nitrospirillum sp. BR 11163]